MKMYPRSGEKRRFDDLENDDEESAIGTLCRYVDRLIFPRRCIAHILINSANFSPV